MTDFSSILKSLSEPDYRNFTRKLVPNTNYEIIGARVPKIKNLAKQLKNSPEILDFFDSPHSYYEEYFLHGLLLGYFSNDINAVLKRVDEFLPYLDNWAICDSMVANLKIFAKHKEIVFDKLNEYIFSNEPYTVRFAIVALLNYFLCDDYYKKTIDLVIKVKSEYYYVNMAIAWFISVALIKRYDYTITIIKNKQLSKFCHNKSIQKAIESFRIDRKTKEFLKDLKIK
jgi:3-methyladenine DNA glycosylase AlkD